MPINDNHLAPFNALLCETGLHGKHAPKWTPGKLAPKVAARHEPRFAARSMGKKSAPAPKSKR